MRNRLHSQLGKATFERDLTRIRAGINRTPPPASAYDHGGLTGLADDDHSHYLHISIARTTTVQHTFNPAAPAAPFILGANAQGQLVTGLNADQWDNQQFASYLNQPVRTSDSVTFAALEIEYDGSNYANITVSPSGTLSLSATGDMQLGPTGGDVLPTTPYAINLGALTNKFLTLHAAELWVETLVASNTMATIGGRIIVAPTSKLSEDLGDGPGDTTMYVQDGIYAVNDYLVMQANNKLEWFKITVVGTEQPNGIPLTVERDKDGSGRNLWYQGDAVINTGGVGDGWIDIYSTSGLYAGTGPAIVGSVRTSNLAYSNFANQFAIGNLNGTYGYSADKFGLGLGRHGGDYITIDPDDGLQFYTSNVRYAQFDNDQLTLGRTTAENILINATALQFRDGTTVYGELTATAWTLGLSTGHHVSITSSAVTLAYNTTDRISLQTDGDMFLGSDISSAATTALAVFNASQTYNGESMTAGDILIGDNNNTTKKANIKYDAGDAALYFRAGRNTNIAITSTGELKITQTGDSENYFRLENTDIAGDASGEYAFVTLNKTDTYATLNGSFGVGYRHNSNNVAAWLFEKSRIVAMLQDATSGYQYAMEILPTTVFLSDSVLQMQEAASAPSAPASNMVRIFVVDNGLGKTVLKAQFATGAAQTIATEP